MAGEITPGDPSYTLTELLHAVNIMMYWTRRAIEAAESFEALGLHVGSGYVYQNLSTEE